MSNIIVKIRESLPDMSGTDKRIARFILEKERELPQLNIVQVAEGSNSSQASVVRFCKRFNKRGFKEFRSSIAKGIVEQAFHQAPLEVYMPTDLKENEELESIVERISNNNVRSIRETKNLLSIKSLERAIDLLSTARRIAFFGVGASGTVAMDAYQKFIRIGKICNMSSDSHVQMTLASSLREKDVAVIISYSGRTRDCIENATIAKEQGATVIALTKFSNENPLSKLADCVLYATSPEGLYRSGATSSRIAQLTIIDILFAGIASRDIHAYYENLEKSYKQASGRKFK